MADVKEKTRIITSRTKLAHKFAWVLKDGAKFKQLIAQLKTHNDELHLLGPEWAFELLQINLALEYLPRQDDSGLDQLQHSATGISSDAETCDSGNGESAGAGDEAEGIGKTLPLVSPSQQGLQLLSDLANIKAEAVLSAREAELSLQEEKTLLSFTRKDFHFGDSGMAIWWEGKETVFIEKHSYKTPKDDDGLSQRIRTNILKLGRLLQLPACVKRLHVLELLGLVEFHRTKEIGFVYRLPGSLGKGKKGFPAEDMQIRKPRIALTGRQGDPSPPLGFRFDLARKLVQSVAFLHASGWLHKNIRTTELYFFPKPNQVISRDSGGIDLDRPFLLGYHFSRPDDVPPDHGSLDQHQTQRNPGRDGAISPLPQLVVRPATENGRASPTHSPPVSPVSTRNELERQDTNLPVSDHLQTGSYDRVDTDYPRPERIRFVERKVKFSRRAIDNEDSEYNSNESSSSHSSSGTPIYRKSREPHRVALDKRHHPSKLAHPGRRYCHAFDVYSLGVALLEIGLWEDIDDIVGQFLSSRDDSEMDPFERRRVIIDSVKDKLLFRCGEIYTRVVMACLTVDPEELDVGPAEQRELCARVAVDLAQCRA